jgi:mono/diheme cytochrome c family protein
MEGRAPESVAPLQATAVRQTMDELFGTPNEPRIPEGVQLRGELLTAAAGPVAGDARGKQRGLFRRHCVTCHGLAGDGAGPTALMLDPYPRDFRSGIFKYTSTRSGAKPIRTDLERTLYRGIPGTAMPSFAHLRPEETDALIEYVKYLSIRGESELFLLRWIVDDQSDLPPEMAIVMEDGVRPAADSWLSPEQRASELVVAAPPRPAVDREDLLAASVARGRELYLAKSSQCVKCHGPNGDGNGEEKELYDDWNKRKLGASEEQTEAMAAWFKLPIRRLRPRDFREGVFHGGAGPADLYCRICVGIKGTPMPAAGPAPGIEGALKPDEIWNVVDFVRSLAAKSKE